MTTGVTDQEAEIIATGLPPSNDLESAIVRDLVPGNYTAIVRGVEQRDRRGIGRGLRAELAPLTSGRARLSSSRVAPATCVSNLPALNRKPHYPSDDQIPMSTKISGRKAHESALSEGQCTFTNW